MKRLAFLLALLIPSVILSQPCLPNGITFTTQEQIDNFQTNYPNCTEIEGNNNISGDSITNLNGLSVLTSIGGNLRITSNDTLTSLTGLDNVISIGGDLVIGHSTYGNPNLTNLTALDNVTSIGGGIQIADDVALTNLIGLEGLTSIEGNLIISYNDALTSLSGLDNVDAASMYTLFITDNFSLTVCEVQSICDYVINLTGFVKIQDNGTACNSQEEVHEACVESIDENYLSKSVNTHPNPFSTSTTIEYELKQHETSRITFYNQFGKQVDMIEESQLQGLNKVIWTPENIADGVYYFRLEAGEHAGSGKVVFVR